ncbi:MAG: rod shape-determining protein RodA [Candidatus Nanopelagicales bacterium]
MSQPVPARTPSAAWVLRSGRPARVVRTARDRFSIGQLKTLRLPTRAAFGPGRTDLALVLATVSLSLIGAVLIWSATGGQQREPDSAVRHLANAALGCLVCMVLSRIDLATLRRYTPSAYLVALAGLVAVLSPLGSNINGAHAWIKLPAGFTLQPSEFAKVAIIVSVALVLADRAAFDAVPGTRDVARALALTAVPVALVMLQPDLGTVLVTGAIVAGMLTIAGTPWRQLMVLAVGALFVVAAAFALGLVDSYQVDRLTAFARPDAGAQTFGYNTQQARIAIGAGGLLGRGLFHGTQTQGGFVPFNHTDFVISVAGEELGLFGVLLLLALLGLVLWQGLTIALHARDLFGRLVATGVVCWFAFQAFENIGMNLGIMPVTGVPLPFVSYGGSSMLAAWIGIGLLMNVQRRTRTNN